MLRCIELGKNGLGSTAPNPMVGCVIVHNNLIIGEGFTSRYGEAHAEVNAIRSIADKSLLKQATLYVTLEPCSHFGKTPPCADLIVEHQIPEVVIGLKDPNDKVSGKGIQRLKDSGCKIRLGVLEKECRKHHRRFLSFQEKKRPYIILKWAETADGFMAPSKKSRSKNPEPFWITDTASRQLVHQWRSEEQAILVGTTTVLHDNPKLTIRNWTGRNPIRLVLDKNLKIPSNFNVFDSSSKTIVCIAQGNDTNQSSGIDYREINFDKDVAAQLCALLYQEEITSVIIEGGAQTLNTFISEDLWDEARIFRGGAVFKEGLAAPKIIGKPVMTQSLVNDTLILIQND